MSSSPTGDADAPAAKRTSGRVRRQPTTIYNSSPYTSSKRKRADDEGADGDADAEEDVSSDDGQSDDSEPDEEEIREKRARARKAKTAAANRPAPKKAKVDRTTTLPIRSAANAGKKRVAKTAKQLIVGDAEDAGGAFAELFARGKNPETLASEWLSAFEQHESRAVAEIINFVLRSAGCTSKVTEHDIEDPDAATSRLGDLQDEYQASNPTDYPLMAKTKGAVSFRQKATGYMEILIESIARKGLLVSNPELLENIQVWLASMSSAVNRAFRHTATAFSLSVITALCEFAKEHAKTAADTRRHAQTENNKSRKNKARVAQLQQQAKDLNEAQTLLNELLKDWFDTIFIHRYRDIDPVIRRDCVTALGDWIIAMPDVFFDGNHLRYLGWVLSDTAPATRGEVVNQLIRLYREKDMIGGLKTFSERFRARMVEIAAADADSSVRASAVELLDRLRENGLLEPDDIDAVGRLVFDSDVKVRKAVAGFVAENVMDMYNSKIDDLGGEETLEDVLPDTDETSSESPRLEWLKFKCLAELLASYDNEDDLPSQIERTLGENGLSLVASGTETRFSLAAQTLCDKIEEIEDWDILSGYLLFDHSSGRANGVANDTLSLLKHECVLTEKEEKILLEALSAGLKRKVSDVTSKLTSKVAKLSKKSREQVNDDVEEIARGLTSLIPKLLRKFGDSPTSAAIVIRLEEILGLPSLKELRQDSATVSDLLDDVKKQFMAHGTDEVLSSATSAILHAKNYGDLDDMTAEKIGGLWEDVVSNLAELLTPSTVAVRGALSYEELMVLSNNLLRIVKLGQVSDCSQALEDQAVAATDEVTGTEYKAAIDYIIGLTQHALVPKGPALDADEAALEDLVASRAAEAALFYLRWKLKAIIDNVTSSTATELPYEELEALATRRDAYVTNLETVLKARRAGDEISYQLATIMLDVYLSSSILKNIKPQAGLSDDYTVLSMDLEKASQRSVMKVFSACEANFAKLSGKKLEEPSRDEQAVDDDPISDPESDDDDDDYASTKDPRHAQSQSQASQQKHEAKLLKSLLAEQKLCVLAGKLVYAVTAGLVDVPETRSRLLRNKARLGANYKEVLAYLDTDKLAAARNAKTKGKAAKSKTAAGPNGVVGSKSTAATAKNSAIVAEDEVDDEIEDGDEDENEDDDNEEGLRRRGLGDDRADREDEENNEGPVGEVDEEESVLGD